MKSLLPQLSMISVLMLLSALPAHTQEIGPMDTSCAPYIAARNSKSIVNWSTNIRLYATPHNRELFDPEYGVEVDVDMVHYKAIRDGQPAWLIVRFYQTGKVLRNIAAGKPNAALGGFSNNIMYVKGNGQCYVSPDRFDDLRNYSKKFAYTLSGYLTFMTLDLKPHPIPPELDSLYKAMSIDQLKMPINAALLRLIKLKNGDDEASAPPTSVAQQQSTPPLSNAEKDRLTRIYAEGFQKFDEENKP